MKRHILILLTQIVLLTFNKILCQTGIQKTPLLDSAYVSSKVSYFTINHGKILGTGKPVITKLFKESQFVILGELHNSKQTSYLVNSLVPIMAENQFSTSAFEVGPNTAEILKRLSSPWSETVEHLKKFNSKYYHPRIQREVIPFFGGVEDAEFLRTMAKYKMHFWGLDQEYYYSIFYFTDEIERLLISDNLNSDKIRELKVHLDQLVEKWMLARPTLKKEGKADAIFESISEDPAFIEYCKAVEKTQNNQAITILNDLKVSWNIYCNWRKGSHQDRISYMRNNFLKKYKEADSPKVFVKVGQMHASQIISNAAYDLGHLLENMAVKNGSVCTNINSAVRYHNYSGEMQDNMKSESIKIKREKVFLQFGKKSEWTLIDLKSIRNDLLENLIYLPQNGDFHRIRELIEGYDFQLILPLDDGVTPNLIVPDQGEKK